MLNPTIHHQKRRAVWHDYSAPGTYMLTLATEARVPVFDRLVDCEKPYIQLSELGERIKQEEVQKISFFYPNVEVWKMIIMPDHLHLIVHVSDYFPEKKTLGNVVRGFKTGCTRAWWDLGMPGQKPGGKAPGTVAKPAPSITNAIAAHTPHKGYSTAATVPGAFPPGTRLPLLFEEGYNDRILLDDGQLDRWKHYLSDNPRRLAIKRRFPQLFSVIYNKNICSQDCQIIGNGFLLDIPDKIAVIVHTRDNDECFDYNMKRWMACGERGGVLVGAFISKREKLVLQKASEMGYRIIHLQENGFSKYYKPTGDAFDACAAGLLLQVSPWQYHTDQRTISRKQCLHLNNLALSIAKL